MSQPEQTANQSNQRIRECLGYLVFWLGRSCSVFCHQSIPINTVAPRPLLLHKTEQKIRIFAQSITQYYRLRMKRREGATH